MDTRPGEQTSSPTDQGEPAAGPATAQSDRRPESRPKGVFPPPRKLSDSQEREVRRLYAETSTPLGEIARRFGISQTSVARIAQRHGASLRSQPGTPSGGQETAPTRARPRRGTARAAEPEPVPVVASRRRGRQRTGNQAAALPEPGVSASSALPQASGGGRRRFRVRFLAEQVIEAEQIREALDRVEALGATEITSIAREA